MSPTERLRRSLPFDATSPRLARRIVRDAFVEPGALAAPDEIELIVSELVTNAVTYGEPPVELVVLDGPGLLRVEVCDGSRVHPSIPTDATRRPHGGRGLQIVQHLCHRWGVSAHPHGKCVWASFDARVN